MIELARWGMELQKAEDVVGLAPSSLPNALRVILRPPAEASFDLGLRSDGQSFALRARDGWIAASRGDARRARPDPLRVADRGLGRGRHRPRRRARGRDRGRGDAAGLAARDGRGAPAPARGSADAGRVGWAADRRRYGRLTGATFRGSFSTK